MKEINFSWDGFWTFFLAEVVIVLGIFGCVWSWRADIRKEQVESVLKSQGFYKIFDDIEKIEKRHEHLKHQFLIHQHAKHEKIVYQNEN